MPLATQATPQVPDKLIYEGRVYDLFANPLESYYAGNHRRPSFYQNQDPKSISTALWRGYVATWEIQAGALYLTEIDSWICNSQNIEECVKADLKQLFGDQYQDGKVKADWYTGNLKMPLGEMLRSVWSGYSSIYEQEIVLQVQAGRIVGKQLVDNTKRKLPSEYELLEQEVEKLNLQLQEAEQGSPNKPQKSKRATKTSKVVGKKKRSE